MMEIRLPASLKRFVKAEFAWITVLLVFLAVTYLPSLTQGKSLSLASQVGCADLAFRDEIRSHIKADCDWSIFLLHMPAEQIVSQMVRKFDLPLWSPNQGCGVSLIGNIVARPFALFSWLAPMCDEPIYSLRLLLQIFVSSLAMGLVGTILKWNSFSKIWLSLTWATAPIHLYQYELSSSSWFYPLAILFITLTLATSSLLSLYIAATGLAFILLSAHPETSFFSIGLGTLVAFSIKASDARETDYWQCLRRILTLATVTFIFSSFVLLPFAEWMHASFLYKTESATPWTFNALWLILSFFSPICGSLSVFFGPFGLFLFISEIVIAKTRNTHSALITLIFSGLVLFISRPGFFYSILSNGAWAWFYPVYSIPVLFITGLLIGGRGLQALNHDQSSTRKRLICLLACAVITVVAILISNVCASPTGKFQAFEPNAVVWKVMLCSVLATTLLAVATCYSSKLDKKLQNSIFASIICISTVGANMLTPDWKLTSYERVDLHCPSIIQSLVKTEDRLLVLGRYYLAANLPSMFQIQDMRFFDATLPQRLNSFQKLCRAKTEETFWRVYSPLVDWRVNLASVNRIVADGPIFDASSPDCTFDSSAIEESKVAGRGLRIKLQNLYVDSESSAVLAELSVVMHKTAQHRYKIRLVSASSDSKNSRPTMATTIEKSGAVQLVWQSSGKLSKVTKLAIQVEDTYKPHEKMYLILLPEMTKLPNNRQRFDLLKIDEHGYRLYCNNQAYPNVFFPNEIKQVSSESEAYQTLASSKNKSSKLAIIESKLAYSQQPENSKLEPNASVILRKSNSVVIQYYSPTDRWLTYTNSFYPGWVARIDGMEKPIEAANVNFMAVYVPAGNHRIEFSYEPKTFWVCFLLAVFTHLVIIGIVLYRWLISKGKQTSS